MAQFNMTGNTSVFVGNAAPGTTYDASSVTASSVAVIDEYGTIITGALLATSNKVRIITSKNGTMKYSPLFYWSNILIKQSQAYTAATDQVQYVGFNGTTGSFDGTASASILQSKTYCLSLELTNVFQYSTSPFIIDVPYLTTSTDQGQFASALQKGAIAKLSLNNTTVYPKQVVVEKVCSGSDNGNTSVTLSVINGGLYATASSSTTGLSVGSVIRMASTGAALTTPVYIVSAISGTTITLDVPYQGSTSTSVQPCIVNTPGNYGLRFTAQPITLITKDQQWEPVTLRAYISNKTDYVSLAATQTTATASSKGSGDWKEVTQIERQHSYAYGQSYVSALPLETPNIVASSSYHYDTIYIRSIDNTEIDKGRTGTAKNPTFDIFIFTDTSLAYNNSNGYSLKTIFTV